MTLYRVTDGNGNLEVEADSAREAAEEFVSGGFWGEVTETFWIKVAVFAIGEDGEEELIGHVKVETNPDEPPCEGGKEHYWQAPYEILGGLKENPGVCGSGGGVRYTVLCTRCGCGKHVNTWACDPYDGEQGLTSVEYVPGEYSEEIGGLQP